MHQSACYGTAAAVGVLAALAAAPSSGLASVATEHVLVGAAVALVVFYFLLVDGSVMITRPLRYRCNPQRPPVFCVGLSRTGTTSIACALDRLGYSAYHSCFKIVRLASGAGGAHVLDKKWASAFDAHSDFAPALVYQQLAGAFPRAKFVLTTRRGGGAAWGASMVRFTQSNRKNHWLLRLHPTANAFFAAMYGTHWHTLSAAAWAAQYDAHNTAVRAFFAELAQKEAGPERGTTRLLEMDITAGQGWETLLPFLCLADDRGAARTVFPHADVFVVSFIHQVWWQCKNAALHCWPRGVLARAVAVAAAALVLLLLPLSPIADFGQCRRKCRIAYGGGGSLSGVAVGAPYPGANASVAGTRNVLRPSTCTCVATPSGAVLTTSLARQYVADDWRWPVRFVSRPLPPFSLVALLARVVAPARSRRVYRALMFAPPRTSLSLLLSPSSLSLAASLAYVRPSSPFV